VRPDPTLLAYIAEHGDACHITVEGTGGREAAADGLRAARDRIRSIPHPDEPSEGLPNWCEVEEKGEGPVLEFDIKDWGQLYAVDIVDILVESLERAGFVGVVRPVGSGYAEAGDEIAGDAMTPSGFPVSFPDPIDAREISATSTYEMAERVWRSSAGGAETMEDLEQRLPAAGFDIVYSGEAIGPPDYTGIIAFSGPHVGEVIVRPAAPGTFVKATVYLGEPPWNAAVRAVDDPDMRKHLRFRIPPR
jgi:hypothetical protein